MNIELYEQTLLGMIKPILRFGESVVDNGVSWNDSEAWPAHTTNVWIVSDGVDLLMKSARGQRYETTYKFRIEVTRVDLRKHQSIYDVVNRVFTVVSGAQLSNTGTAFFVTNVSALTRDKDAGYWGMTISVSLSTIEPTGYCGA